MRVTIHYFKPTSGKWYCEDEDVEWPEDPDHFSGWAPFESVARMPDMTAVCLDTPLGFPVSRPGNLEAWK